VSDEPKPDEAGPFASPAMQALQEARATGRTPDGEVPLPPDMLRRREEWREYAKQQQAAQGSDIAARHASDAAAAEQGPGRHIGPKNPDHPHVNRKPSGREPS
jgi:hypothetical protein